jgi:hypothetical protein
MVEPAPGTAGERQPDAYSGTHLGGCGTRRARPGSVARPCILQCGAPRPKGELTHPVTSSARQQEQLKDQSKRLGGLDMRSKQFELGGELRGKRLTRGRADEIGLRADKVVTCGSSRLGFHNSRVRRISSLTAVGRTVCCPMKPSLHYVGLASTSRLSGWRTAYRNGGQQVCRWSRVAHGPSNGRLPSSESTQEAFHE